MWLDDQPTALYRLYDSSGLLLYVGMSYDPETRFEQHRRDKPWWPEVARHTLQWFEDRPAAAKAEAEAIRAEDPPHNGIYSPSRDWKTARDEMSDDGVRYVSLSLARTRLSGIIREVQAGTPAMLLLHGRPRAVLMSAELYERAVAALGSNAQRS